MRAPETLTREAWRGYQCDTFPAGSWVSEGDMLRTVAEAARIDLITRHQYRHFALELEWREERGHIALQHHGDVVWFRHLHIRLLPD